MERARAKYERDGFYTMAEQVAPDAVLQGALKGMVAVRDGIFDMGLAPTEHPGYDPQVLCKINNPHRSDKGLYELVTCPELGQLVAEVTGSQMVQVWASQLLIKPPGSAAAGHVGWHQDRQSATTARRWQRWRRYRGRCTLYGGRIAGVFWIREIFSARIRRSCGRVSRSLTGKNGKRSRRFCPVAGSASITV